MTIPHADGRQPTEAAISAGMAAGDTEAVMRAVAASDVVVPQVAPEPGSEPTEEGAVSLPVIEKDGTQFVPVFTSETTMSVAAPDLEDAVTVSAAQLGANWPSDELWLAVNPGTEEGLTLPPDAVRSLPLYADGTR